MFIPRDSINVGSKVILSRNAETSMGTFTKGHEFIVNSIDTLKGMVVYNLVDKDGFKLNDVTSVFL